MVHIYQGMETTHRITNGVCAIQRSNVEHARGGQLWSPFRQFPAQDFKGKPNEKMLFRKLSERKLKLSYKSVKWKEKWKKEHLRLNEHKAYSSMAFPLIYYSVLSLTKIVVRF